MSYTLTTICNITKDSPGVLCPIAFTEIEKPNVTRKLRNKELNIKVQLITIDSMKTYFKTALIDSGYTSSCISQKFIQENKLETKRYTTPITCYNANGSPNKSGGITDFIEMNMIIGDHIE